jgi:hypothetical protein
MLLNHHYCQTNSILFQFILNQFLEATTIVKKIETLSEELSDFSQNPKELSNSENLKLLQSSIEQLVVPPKSDSSAPWSKKEGSFQRLSHFSFLFSKKAEGMARNTKQLSVVTSQACHHAFLIQEAIYIFKTHRSLFNFQQLETKLNLLVKNKLQLGKVIQSIAEKYMNNENIIFFLLKNKKLFDQNLSSLFLIDIFLTAFPKGKNEIKDFLIQKYTERKFHHLIPEIETSISSLGANNEYAKG